jgi:hypothetical protein
MYAVYSWTLSAMFLVVYVSRGVWLAGMGLRGVTTLLCAPLYLVWKVALPLLQGAKQAGWVRTSREPQLPRRARTDSRQMRVVAPQVRRRHRDVTTAP